MDGQRDSLEKKYFCFFTIEESGIFVAWTSLIFGFFYALVAALDLFGLTMLMIINSIFYLVFFIYLLYFVHALLVIYSFSLIKKAIKRHNHSDLSLPIAVQAIGTFIIVYQFFARWDGQWYDYSYILAGIIAFSAFVIVYFLSILIRLHSHLRKISLTASDETPTFVNQRLPPPSYNSTQMTAPVNSNFGMPSQPPHYNQIYPVQSQNNSNLATQDENRY